MKRLSQLLLLGALILLSVKGVQAEPPKDPIYIKTSNGWNAVYAHGNEYAEFRVIGKGAKLQDPYHILLQKGVGMMVSFVDKKELQNDMDLLSAHAQWEIDYWHQHASRVESNIREDLTGTRKDLKVTEIRVYNDKGAQMSSYLIGLAAKDGVFALSVSPAKKDIDPLVKELVSSFKLVPRNLDAEETKRLSSEAAEADAIKLKPKDAGAYYNRGIAKLDKGDFDGAIADYNRVIELDPKFTDAYCNRALAKHDKGDVDGAIADYTRAIELGSTNRAAYNNRGAEKLKKGDFDGAITDCNRAIELDPEYANAYAIRAYARDRTGDSDGAMADLGRAIKLNPKNASAYDLRGEIEARKKQYAAAAKDEQKASELDPKNGRLYSNLGLCELFNRKPRQSIAASLKALKLSPDKAVAIKSNLAHGYLFDNQFGKAKAIYLENKDAKLDDGRTFSQVVLDDFKEFQEAGITHPDMEKIKALLTIKAQDTNSTNSY
jgi:tetratricopeptide (TPR) repeat protein